MLQKRVDNHIGRDSGGQKEAGTLRNAEANLDSH